MAGFRQKGFSLDQMDALLARLPLAIRGKSLKKAMKKNGNTFAKEYRTKLPKGSPTDSPDKRQLYRLVSTKLIDGRIPGIFIAVTGVRTSADGEGWYTHLKEDGFKHTGFGGAFVPGKKSLVQSRLNTEQARHFEILRNLEEIIIEAGG